MKAAIICALFSLALIVESRSIRDDRMLDGPEYRSARRSPTFRARDSSRSQMMMDSQRGDDERMDVMDDDSGRRGDDRMDDMQDSQRGDDERRMRNLQRSDDDRMDDMRDSPRSDNKRRMRGSRQSDDERRMMGSQRSDDERMMMDSLQRVYEGMYDMLDAARRSLDDEIRRRRLQGVTPSEDERRRY